MEPEVDESDEQLALTADISENLNDHGNFFYVNFIPFFLYKTHYAFVFLNVPILCVC